MSSVNSAPMKIPSQRRDRAFSPAESADDELLGELGDLFNIKDFHETVLRSAGPLDVVEEQVNKGSCQFEGKVFKVFKKNKINKMMV